MVTSVLKWSQVYWHGHKCIDMVTSVLTWSQVYWHGHKSINWHLFTAAAT